MSDAAGQGLWRIDAAACGAIVAIAAACWTLGVRPLSEARAERERQSTAVVAQRGAVQELEGRLRAGEARLAELRGEIERSVLQLGTASGLNERVDALTSLAKESGLRVDAIRPGEATPGALYTAVPIQMSGLGTSPTSVMFLRSLRGRFPDVGVTSIDLRTPADRADNKVVFSFGLVWFTAPASARSKPSR